MIIVTGSNGFIGKHFIDDLQKKGKDVLKIDKENLKDFRSSFKEWPKVDLIIHQGALSDTTQSSIKNMYKFNVEWTEWLFNKAKEHKIITKYASSASVYGNQQTTVNPLNYYAISKLIIDIWVKDNLKYFDFIQGFRYFNVYGEGEEVKGNQASPISKFTIEAKTTGKIKIFDGSENFLRDFVHVSDVVDIVLNNKKPSGIYDLGTSKPISFLDVANNVVKKYGGEIVKIPFPDNLIGKYQTYTCAKEEWAGYKFKTVKEYLR